MRERLRVFHRWSGILNPASAGPFYDGAGFTQPPVTFGGGVHNINTCLVGNTPDGVVLAFRGTLPLPLINTRGLAPLDARLTFPNLETMLDWMNDFNADLVAAPGMPGLIHHGFLGSLDSLWAAARDEVKRQLAAGGQLWITGHSKGGAIAPLAAVRFQAEGIVPRVVTFAAAKVGDEAFASSYNSQFAHTRYEYADDIVPHLPPSADLLDLLSHLPLLGSRLAALQRYNYRAVGTLEFIDWSGHLIEDTPTLRTVRFLSLAKMIVTGQFRGIGLDHSISCGSGYMTGLCPDGVCS